MEEFVKFTAKTKNEAITKACIELGATSDGLEIQVVSEGSSGFLGFGSKPAVIMARKKEEKSADEEFKEIIENVAKAENEEPAPVKEKKTEKKPEKKAEKKPAAEAKKDVPASEKKETRTEKKNKPKSSEPKVSRETKKESSEKPNKAAAQKTEKASKSAEILTDEKEISEIEKRAETFLASVFASMKLGEVEIKSVYNRTDGSLEVDFEGENMGVLIGKRGQTLDSLQYLTSLVVNKGRDKYVRVKLDTEDYRNRRRDTLENLARGIAYKVKKTRKPVVLEPMNPYERRIIHSALQGSKFVETVSEGEEPYRHIVVKPKKYSHN